MWAKLIIWLIYKLVTVDIMFGACKDDMFFQTHK